MELTNGALFYLSINGEYDLYKIIDLGEDGSVYVRAYWSTDVFPILNRW